jgi:hypothetical protein
MDRLVGSVSRLASPERAEPSHFPELARWASRARLVARASQARLGSFPPLRSTPAPVYGFHSVCTRKKVCYGLVLHSSLPSPNQAEMVESPDWKSAPRPPGVYDRYTEPGFHGFILPLFRGEQAKEEEVPIETSTKCSMRVLNHDAYSVPNLPVVCIMGGSNFTSLRGFETIDVAKAKFEAACSGKISCADIIAFTASVASYFLSNDDINFAIPAGRYDGTISITSEILPNLPPRFAGFDQLVKMFADKGVGTLEQGYPLLQYEGTVPVGNRYPLGPLKK